MSEQTIAQIRPLLVTDEPADLGPGPRSGVMSERELNARLDSLLGKTDLSSTRKELVRSLLLLWHDHLDASHNISQRIENADGSFVHAIMHRREPDAWNSKYWYAGSGSIPPSLRLPGASTNCWLVAADVRRRTWPGVSCQAVTGTRPLLWRHVTPRATHR